MTTQLGRRIPTDTELYTLITAALKDLALSPSFTAWDISNEIRAGHSDLEISHDRVRPMVHGTMEALIAAGASWDFEHREYTHNGIRATARTYFNPALVGTAAPVLPAPPAPSADPADYVIKVY